MVYTFQATTFFQSGVYSCKLRNTIPMVQVCTQLVMRSMEIEKQIAFGKKKWATFCPSENNLFAIILTKTFL